MSPHENKKRMPTCFKGYPNQCMFPNIKYLTVLKCMVKNSLKILAKEARNYTKPSVLPYVVLNDFDKKSL